MAINVRYEPAAAEVAGAAYAGGLGQFQAKRFQQGLALAELADRQQARQDQMQFQLAARAQDAAMRDYFGNKNFQQQLAIQDFAGQRGLALQRLRDQDLAKRQAEDDARRAQLEQQQADLNQRNWMMQNAPGAALDPAAAVPPMPDAIVGRQTAIDMNRQALAMPAQFQDRALMTAIRRGDPSAIAQGVSRGILAYSPEQKTEIRRIQEAMSRLDSDPTMSPFDRSRGQRILAEKLYGIRPMEVPPQERAPTFEEEVKSKITLWTDPRTGKVYPVTMDRNGVPTGVKGITDKEPGQTGAGAKPPPPTTVRETVQSDPKGFIAINKAAEAAVMGRLQPNKETGQVTIPDNYDQLVEQEIEKLMRRQEKFGARPRPPEQQQPMQPQQPGQVPTIPAGGAGEELPLIHNRQELLRSGLAPGQRFSGPDGTIYEVTPGGSQRVGHYLDQEAGPPAESPQVAAAPPSKEMDYSFSVTPVGFSGQPPQQPKQFVQPASPREAYAAIQAAVQGTPRAGRYPAGASDQQIAGLLQQPDVRRDLLQAGIILPRTANQPPPPPPPLIQPTKEGLAQLNAMLKQNPAGVLIRDARDGQLKFIKGINRG